METETFKVPQQVSAASLYLDTYNIDSLVEDLQSRVKGKENNLFPNPSAGLRGERVPTSTTLR